MTRLRQLQPANQKVYVLSYLQRNPQGATTLDFQKQFITAPSGVIRALRQDNYVIETTLEDVVDTNGVLHRRMARYHYVSGPVIEAEGGENE